MNLKIVLSVKTKRIIRFILTRILALLLVLKKMLRRFGFKQKPKILLYCVEPFHLHHIKPVIEKLENDEKVELFFLGHDLYPQAEDEDLTLFISPKLFVSVLAARLMVFDLTIYLSYSMPVWLPKVGLRVFTPHGDGMKSSYTGSDELRLFDIIWATGKVMYGLQQQSVTDKAVVERVGFIVADFDHKSNISLPETHTENELPIVLYAPSWGREPGCILLNETILEILSKQNKFRIILRPHPYLLIPSKCHGKNWGEVMTYCVNERFTLATDYSRPIQEQMRNADVLLSDISSVIYEFLFFDRPIVLNVDSRVIEQYNGRDAYEEIKQCAFEILEPYEIMEKLEMALEGANLHSKNRKKVLESRYYNIGKASDVAVANIYSHVGV